MAEREFDEIKEKLYDHEEPVDEGLWQDIQESLRLRKARRFFYRALSSAAVIVAIFLALTSIDRRGVHELEYFAQMISKMPVPEAAVVESNGQREIFPLPQICREKEADTYQTVPELYADVFPVEQRPHKVRAAMVQKGSAGKMGAADANADAENADAAVGNALSDVQMAVVGETAVPTGESAGASVAGEERPHMMEEASAGSEGWDELLQMEKKGGKRYAMAFTGGIMPGSSASVAGSRIMAVSAADNLHHGYMVEQVSDTKYSLPLNLGMQFQFPIGEKLSLGAGVSYTMLRSRFDCLVNKVRYSGQQTLHYIGIPVNVYGMVAQRDKFMFYVNGGAMIEKGIRAKYKFSSYKDSYSNSTKMDGLQFSVNAGLGVEYRFSDYMGLYFEPNIIYFTNSDMQYCIRTDQPLQIKAELGCRFHF